MYMHGISFILPLRLGSHRIDGDGCDASCLYEVDVGVEAADDGAKRRENYTRTSVDPYLMWDCSTILLSNSSSRARGGHLTSIDSSTSSLASNNTSQYLPLHTYSSATEAAAASQGVCVRDVCRKLPGVSVDAARMAASGPH